ncbi:hypothetical protein OBBRIDRAFT_532180 [Obba rivulosa]|uniref:Uncharacterized protein n=1 Tax=Obba rivulosa TaxID=1052685 RepID=A0A8E2B031_9APHY|nr:hypothetical protein OBBRIDRAFT_532180 [Obba rivulosa]
MATREIWDLRDAVRNGSFAKMHEMLGCCSVSGSCLFAGEHAPSYKCNADDLLTNIPPSSSPGKTTTAEAARVTIQAPLPHGSHRNDRRMLDRLASTRVRCARTCLRPVLD